MAAGMAVLGLLRVLFVDLHAYPDEMVMPVLNSVALPSLGVAGLMLAALVGTRPYRDRMNSAQRSGLAAAGLAVLIVLWSGCAHGHLSGRHLETPVIVQRYHGQVIARRARYHLRQSLHLSIDLLDRLRQIRDSNQEASTNRGLN